MFSSEICFEHPLHMIPCSMRPVPIKEIKTRTLSDHPMIDGYIELRREKKKEITMFDS